jgi:hypothetical protein
MDRMLTDIAARFPTKRVLIAEFASEESATKPDWIRDAYTQMKARPQVMGAVWFDMKKEADWRIASSPAAVAAYREAIGTSLLVSR